MLFRSTSFLGDRIPFRRATVVDDADGTVLGETDAIELVTLGQRRGIGVVGGGPKRYVVAIDHETAVVRVGDEAALSRVQQTVRDVAWSADPVSGPVRAQCSAHGTAHAATLEVRDEGGSVEVRWDTPQRVVSPGQSVVFYDAEDRVVLGGGTAV